MHHKLKKEIDSLEDRLKRIVNDAILQEREICAGIALWRQNLYTDIGQKNVCKEIYSSILYREDGDDGR